ncbi:hypothetical protein J6590_039704 [Homalodisca vitripennis]|nr:hypothetical protein J6590_039704 [Homalodisca vitripennis]
MVQSRPGCFSSCEREIPSTSKRPLEVNSFHPTHRECCTQINTTLSVLTRLSYGFVVQCQRVLFYSVSICVVVGMKDYFKLQYISISGKLWSPVCRGKNMVQPHLFENCDVRLKGSKNSRRRRTMKLKTNPPHRFDFRDTQITKKCASERTTILTDTIPKHGGATESSTHTTVKKGRKTVLRRERRAEARLCGPDKTKPTSRVVEVEVSVVCLRAARSFPPKPGLDGSDATSDVTQGRFSSRQKSSAAVPAQSLFPPRRVALACDWWTTIAYSLLPLLME